jgi:hypothetical protein
MNRRELKKVLKEEGFNPRRYSLRGGLPDETYCLDEPSEGSWSVYYSERGEKVGARAFETEDEACAHLLHLLRRDPSAKR